MQIARDGWRLRSFDCAHQIGQAQVIDETFRLVLVAARGSATASFGGAGFAPTPGVAKKSASAIKKVAKLMRDLDFCMFTTLPTRGGTHSRPMSNNGEVEFDGDVWFFSAADSRKVREIKANPHVHLAFVDLGHWRFLSVSGKARIVRDVKKKHELWMKELEQWFDEGPESDAIVLIKVRPSVVSYWTKNDSGQLRIA